MLFSERIGKTELRSIAQIETIDRDLKNRLWNNVRDDFILELNGNSFVGYDSERGSFCKYIWKEFYKNPSDNIPRSDGGVDIAKFLSYLKSWFFESEWFQIYNLIDFIVQIPEKNFISFIQQCNRSLELEMSGYRIIDSKVVPITASEEIETIEKALSESDNNSPIKIHLDKALEMISDRQNPDYRNSIKESISAVEALCIKITGDNNTTLGKTLAILEKDRNLHGSLKSAFSALYGYTSDSSGIRHALTDNSEVLDFADAKFMLVSCTAFINYLRTKYNI